MVWLWFGFVGFVLLLLALDLGVFHRHSHAVPVREALLWSSVWASETLCGGAFRRPRRPRRRRLRRAVFRPHHRRCLR